MYKHQQKKSYKYSRLGGQDMGMMSGNLITQSTMNSTSAFQQQLDNVIGTQKQLEISEKLVPDPVKEIVVGKYMYKNVEPDNSKNVSALSGTEQTTTYSFNNTTRAVNPSKMNLLIQGKVKSTVVGGANSVGTVFLRKNESLVKRMRVYTHSNVVFYDSSELNAFSNSILYRNGLIPDQLKKDGVLGKGDAQIAAYAGPFNRNYDIYYVNGTLAAAGYNFYRNYNLGQTFGGWFKLDKDLIIGETWYIDITFMTLPEAGFTMSVADQFSALGAVEFTKCYIRHSLQIDDILNNSIKANILNGVVYPFEWVSSNKLTPNAGTEISFSHTVKATSGSKLKKIIYVPIAPSALGIGANSKTGLNKFSRVVKKAGDTVDKAEHLKVKFELDSQLLSEIDFKKREHQYIDYNLNENEQIEGFYPQQGDINVVDTTLTSINNNWFLPIDVQNLDEKEENVGTDYGIPTIGSDRTLTVTSYYSDIPGITDHIIFTIGVKYMKLQEGLITII